MNAYSYERDDYSAGDYYSNGGVYRNRSNRRSNIIDYNSRMSGRQRGYNDGYGGSFSRGGRFNHGNSYDNSYDGRFVRGNYYGNSYGDRFNQGNRSVFGRSNRSIFGRRNSQGRNYGYGYGNVYGYGNRSRFSRYSRGYNPNGLRRRSIVVSALLGAGHITSSLVRKTGGLIKNSYSKVSETRKANKREFEENIFYSTDAEFSEVTIDHEKMEEILDIPALGVMRVTDSGAQFIKAYSEEIKEFFAVDDDSVSLDSGIFSLDKNALDTLNSMKMAGEES